VFWGVWGFGVYGGFGCLEVFGCLGVLGCLGVTVKGLRLGVKGLGLRG